MSIVRVPLESEAIEYDVEGETAYGGDVVLLAGDDDLLAETAFAELGYGVAPFLAAADHAALVEGVRQLLWSAFAEMIRAVPDLAIPLALYHREVTDAEHPRFVQATGLNWRNEDLPIPMAVLERRVSAILGIDVEAINPNFAQQRFQVRVVRPGRRDNNPPHRDVWLDRLRNAVNIYVPLAGSDRLSSLPLVPGSHRWKESEIERTVSGARVDGVQYTVPAVTGARRPLALVRPPVRANEVMVFSPYAIHGGGVNANAGTTRVSLEIRFWRRR